MHNPFPLCYKKARATCCCFIICLANSPRQLHLSDMATAVPSASTEDLKVITEILTYADVHFRQHLGKDVLWVSDVFFDIAGFSKQGNTIRHARTKNLIHYELSLSSAVGLTELRGFPIVNPIPADTPVAPSSRAKAYFMTTWSVLEFLSGGSTPQAQAVRKALWYFFFTSEKAHLQKQLEEAEQKVRKH